MKMDVRKRKLLHDPSLVATAGPRNCFGEYNGELYEHKTGGLNTDWKLLSNPPANAVSPGTMPATLQNVDSVGAAVAGNVVRRVASRVYALAKADARATAQGIVGVYDGSRIRCAGEYALVTFDSAPALGPCYLSSATAGLATSAPTIHLTMPRLLGEAVELVDTTHSIVLLNPDPNGSAGPFQIFNYTVPAPSMGGSLFVPYTVSAKFGYTVKASWKGTVATGMRVQVQGLNSNTYYTWFNYQGTGTGDGDNGVVIGVSAAGAWMEAEAAVQPRTNASSQVRATSGIYPHTAAMRLVSVGEFAVDFTQLGFVFDQYITLGTVIVNMFDPNGVG